jgi:hypothetical protein
MLSVKVPGRERGRPVDPSSMRQQKLIAKKMLGRSVDPSRASQQQVNASERVDEVRQQPEIVSERVDEVQNTKYMSFAEIIQSRESNVKVSPDGLIHAVDLVMVMTGKNRNHSNETLRTMNPSLFNQEKYVIQDRRKLVTFQHAIELVMVLPGRVAKETRTHFANIIRRYALHL